MPREAESDGEVARGAQGPRGGLQKEVREFGKREGEGQLQREKRAVREEGLEKARAKEKTAFCLVPGAGICLVSGCKKQALRHNSPSRAV